MKKIIILSLCLCLAVGIGYSFAKNKGTYDSENIIDVGGTGGSTGLIRPTHVVKVRYGAQGTSLNGLLSGEAVVWDRVSNDGYTVTECQAAGDEGFAGILVTDIATADVNDTSLYSTYNTGYMAVFGYVLASIDAAITPSAGNAGLAASVSGSLGSSNDNQNSQDVATLLQTSVAGSKAAVWLRSGR